MYRRILLAVDPEGLAESALPIVGALARRSGGEVFVVGVTTTGDLPAQRAALDAQVRQIADELKAAGIKAVRELREAKEGSSVPAEIVAACRERGADLVALGSHGRGSVGTLVQGSVGRQVLSKVDAAAVLVHSRGAAHRSLVPRPLRRILVPVDYSEASRQAVQVAQDLAREDGATVLILHARELVPWLQASYAEPLEEAQHLVERLSVGPREAGVAVKTQITEPELNAAPAIVKAADEWDADLIVLGSRRMTTLGGLFLGSVAHGVIQQSNRPVLIAGHPAHEPIERAQEPGR